MQRLYDYFTDGIASKTLQSVGAEVETQFYDDIGFAISTETSQKMLGFLAKKGWWKIIEKKGYLITSLIDKEGNQINYELGRHNIEISTAPFGLEKIIIVTRSCLEQLYISAETFGAKPYFAPVFFDDGEDLLVIPDERDATWLQLDGRLALAPLAKTSSVQFTLSVSPEEAILVLNRLGGKIDAFLSDYPQEDIWKRYIQTSLAGYGPDRYGGPILFDSLGDYCSKIAKNDVVVGKELVPYKKVESLNIPLYLRSIWWYFRLKRYGNDLCVEVRPIPRKEDSQFDVQLKNVLEIVLG